LTRKKNHLYSSKPCHKLLDVCAVERVRVAEGRTRTRHGTERGGQCIPCLRGNQLPTAPPARSRRAYLSAADRTDCSPAGGPGSLCTCRRPLALAAIGQDKGRRIIVLARDRARDPATAPACVNLYGSTYCIRRKLTLFLSPPWRRCWPCSIRTHGLTGAFAIIPCMSNREKLAPK
jgi:hypothetical protein